MNSRLIIVILGCALFVSIPNIAKSFDPYVFAGGAQLIMVPAEIYKGVTAAQGVPAGPPPSLPPGVLWNPESAGYWLEPPNPLMAAIHFASAAALTSTGLATLASGERQGAGAGSYGDGYTGPEYAPPPGGEWEIPHGGGLEIPHGGGYEYPGGPGGSYEYPGGEYEWEIPGSEYGGISGGSFETGGGSVAADLFNPDLGSGFGVAGLSGTPGSEEALKKALAENGKGSGGGFGGSGSAAQLAEALEKQLSTMPAGDLAKLQLGDRALIGDLMRSMGLFGNPDGIDFSMFNGMLQGMLRRQGRQPRFNGVLLADLIMDPNISIWKSVRSTNEFAFWKIIKKFIKENTIAYKLLAKKETNKNKGSLLRTSIMENVQ